MQLLSDRQARVEYMAGVYRRVKEYNLTAKLTKIALPSSVASTMGPTLSSSIEHEKCCKGEVLHAHRGT
jgi:hypothetical protein